LQVQRQTSGFDFTIAPPAARSASAFARAQRVLVGGVNSPVRAFGAVGGQPRFVERAEGPFIFDIDGNRYTDLVGSWGPAIVGHAHPQVVAAVQEAATNGLSFGACCESEAELAELILSALPGHEKIRFVNSGTEAVMSAVRLARAVTGRDRIIKFEGNYHGHADMLLVAAGSGAATHGVPNSAGVPPAAAAMTLPARYNDLDSVTRLVHEHDGEVAALLVEPVAGNMGFVPPSDGFLEGLRLLCDEHGTMLIFDEVMTGFRVAWGGYQSIIGVRPDITTLGKVIGGGMPVAAFAARAEIMDLLSPLGPVYQAGTLSGNPIGMAAGLATLRLCRAEGFYDRLDSLAHRLVEGLQAAAAQAGVALTGGATGGMAGFAFSASPPRDYDDAKRADHARFARFFHAMLDRGVWLPPSGYEACFVSAAHTEAEIDAVIDAAAESIRAIAP
jgi:glutamate-1-semialdehyde 2,1-aminomutase